MSRALRLPLITGHDVRVGFVLFGAVFMFPITVWLLVIPLIFFGWGDVTAGWAAFAFFVGIFGSVAVLGTRAYLSYVWAGRPSDIVLTADHVAIRGGPANGLRVALADIDSDASGIYREGLVLAMRDGTRHIVRKGIDSIGEPLAFLDIVRAAVGQPARAASAWRHDAPAPVEPEQSAPEQSVQEAAATDHAMIAKLDIVRCASCGAPQAPSSEPAVPCAHCGAPCEMSTAVRARVAEVSKIQVLDAAGQKMLQQILEQPSSRSAARAFTLGGIVAIAAWLLSIAVVTRAISVHHGQGIGLRAFTLLLLIGLMVVILLWRWLAARQSVHAVMLSFGATAPASERDAPGCRACAGPLAITAGAFVVVCSYCTAPNVLGVDLPRAFRTQGKQDALTAALRKRSRTIGSSMRLLAIAAPITIALAVLWGPGLARGLTRSSLALFAETCSESARGCTDEIYDRPDGDQVKLLRAACDLDDAESCLRLGTWHHLGQSGLPKDSTAAKHLIDRSCKLGLAKACAVARVLPGADEVQLVRAACDAGDAHSCMSLGLWYRVGLRGLPKDPAAAKSWIDRACKLGDPLACERVRRLP